MPKENKQLSKTKKVEKKEEIKTLRVLINPRMTEKSVIMQESRGVYTFNVEKDATKKTIARAVKAEYKVTPIKVRVASVPPKNKFVRGKWGVKSGGKKAYVYLKKGDKIDVA